MTLPCLHTRACLCMFPSGFLVKLPPQPAPLYSMQGGLAGGGHYTTLRCRSSQALRTKTTLAFSMLRTVSALAAYSHITLGGSCRLYSLFLLIVRLCLELSLLVFVANFKQNLFYTLKSLDKTKLTRVLCLLVHICAVAGKELLVLEI